MLTNLLKIFILLIKRRVSRLCFDTRRIKVMYKLYKYCQRCKVNLLIPISGGKRRVENYMFQLCKNKKNKNMIYRSKRKDQQRTALFWIEIEESKINKIILFLLFYHVIKIYQFFSLDFQMKKFRIKSVKKKEKVLFLKKTLFALILK